MKQNYVLKKKEDRQSISFKKEIALQKESMKMKKMQIFEPAMCCSTGLCGTSIDPELLRISTLLNTLKNNGVIIDRFNLSNAPQEFIKNSKISEKIKSDGIECLPMILVDGEIVIERRYPTNEEISHLLGISFKNYEQKDEHSCGCNPSKKGGCC